MRSTEFLTYFQLLSVTHIIHNAWPVNFNRTVTSFDASITALENLVHLAIFSAATPVGTVLSYALLSVSGYGARGRSQGPGFALLFSVRHPNNPLMTDAF